MFDTVEKIKPDVIVLGYNQAHHEDYIMAGCGKIGLT